MKKYKKMFYNNYNIIVSSSLLSISAIIFWLASMKFISIIIFIFLSLILFYTLQDKLESYIRNIKINKANKDCKKETNEKKETSSDNNSINNTKSYNDKSQENSFDSKIQNKISKISDYDLVLIINDALSKINFILEKTCNNKSYKRTYNSIIDYYIPTIEKFIDKYIELDETYMENYKKDKIRKDIKNSICIINYGFQKIKNDFDNDTLIDIYSDIDVLRTILIKDGLISEKDFPKITYKI